MGKNTDHSGSNYPTKNPGESAEPFGERQKSPQEAARERLEQRQELREGSVLPYRNDGAYAPQAHRITVSELLDTASDLAAFDALAVVIVNAVRKMEKDRWRRPVTDEESARIKGTKASIYALREVRFPGARSTLWLEPQASAAGAKLRDPAELGHKGEMGKDATSPKTPPIEAAFTNASLDDLASAFTQDVPDAALKRLEVLLREAQKTPPADKAGFVESVNMLLDVLAVRIQSDGETGRLTLSRGSSIRLTRASGGQRSFKTAQIELVRVHRTQVGNRFTGTDPQL